MTPDPVARYGYTRTDNGVRCASCGTTFTSRPGDTAVGGDVMRSHAARCPVNPRTFHVPARCHA